MFRFTNAMLCVCAPTLRAYKEARVTSSAFQFQMGCFLPCRERFPPPGAFSFFASLV